MTTREPVEITLRGIPHSTALEARIRSKVGKLARLFPSLKHCRVVAEVPHQRHTQGNQFVVRLDITLPGREVIVNRDHHEDIYVALREAFRAARRQLNGHNGRHTAAMGRSGADN